MSKLIIIFMVFVILALNAALLAVCAWFGRKAKNDKASRIGFGLMKGTYIANIIIIIAGGMVLWG